MADVSGPKRMILYTSRCSKVHIESSPWSRKDEFALIAPGRSSDVIEFVIY